MLINADSTSNRTEILIEKYLELLKNGVPAENILVLVQNSKKKKEFIDAVKTLSPLGNIGSLRVYGFYGLIYNFISDNWPEVENSIKSTSNVKIIPNLCGLEVSQYILKECIKEVDFSGYNSKMSLLHQLLRRNSLITINDLTDDEVKKRADILQESWSDEALKALNKYKAKSVNLRAFDYIRQINIFQFLYKKIKNEFEYVFLDDADEITPCVLSYLEYIKPDVKEFFIGYDSLGSSRLGYLGAINVDFEKFLNEKAIKLPKTEKSKRAKTLSDSVKKDIPVDLINIQSKSYLRRDEMIDGLIESIKTLIKSGVRPCEISIVTPLCDKFLKTYLEKALPEVNFNFLSKSEKLNENPVIGYILELLKIINDKNNTVISPYIIKGILIELLGFSPKKSAQFAQEYKIQHETDSTGFFDLVKTKKEKEFVEFFELYEKIRFENLSVQMYETVNKYVDFSVDNSKNIIKINRLLKQICDFEDVFSSSVAPRELINQLENTIISENPLSDDEINDDSVVVSSAQKIIDYSHKTKYSFLLDTKSDQWLKNDIGPLYNAWVMQKKWDKPTFELEDNINLTKDRTARILYKLCLLSDNFTLFSSDYDTLGQENFSGIDKYFKQKNELEQKPAVKPIVPRPDQKEVLNYKGAKMAVNAAAGSGKTTIMLLLVDKILSREILSEIEAESKNIFVLTFMESAARNFKERIKQKYPNLKELPSISTIHGLALRILKENNNYSKLGLDSDFEITDEIKKSAILSEILSECGISNDKTDLYDRAISTYKNELARNGDYVSSNRLFVRVYEGYTKKLTEQNLIDYDDLLLLSLKLLRSNEDVLNYYQNLVKIIIEDEAQDSSYTQQSLIMLLGGKYNNIVRCGDINQAITSTFSNSDVEGFREFIKNAKSVVMDRCQRCATGVLDCANNLVASAKENKINAFSDLIMKPVENVNIIDKNAVFSQIFENEPDEIDFTVNKIKNILKDDPKATIGVLLRSNFTVGKWEKILAGSNIKTCGNSDALINNPVFKTCLLIMQYVLNPYDIAQIKKTTKELYELGLYDFSSVKAVEKLTCPPFLADIETILDDNALLDFDYFLYKNHCCVYDLAYEIGSFYFSNTPQKVNIPLVAAIAEKIYLTQKTFENTLQRLIQIQYKNNFSNIKFFAGSENKSKQATVQLMTLHKSKGDEFDYVFIPELTRDNLCFTQSELKLKESSTFTQKVKEFPKTEAEIKNEIIEENARLIYVGITRAKKKLYLTASTNYKYFNKTKSYVPSEIFEGVKSRAKC